MHALKRSTPFFGPTILLIAAVVLVLATMLGCTTGPPTAADTIKAADIALTTVTAAREASLSLYQAGKITAAQDTTNQARLTLVRQSILAAKAASDAAAVAAAKADADKALATIKGSP